MGTVPWGKMWFPFSTAFARSQDNVVEFALFGLATQYDVYNTAA